MFEDAVVAVLVVPVSWVSQGGFEHTCPAPIAAEEVVAVLVVPVSWVSQGGLEQTKVTVPEPSPAAPASVELGCSEVGDARIDTGRSWTGWASTPLGVVIRVTWVGWFWVNKAKQFYKIIPHVSYSKVRNPFTHSL